MSIPRRHSGQGLFFAGGIYYKDLYRHIYHAFYERKNHYAQCFTACGCSIPWTHCWIHPVFNSGTVYRDVQQPDGHEYTGRDWILPKISSVPFCWRSLSSGVLPRSAGRSGPRHPLKRKKKLLHQKSKPELSHVPVQSPGGSPSLCSGQQEYVGICLFTIFGPLSGVAGFLFQP